MAVTGQVKMNEKDYRQLPEISYSSIKEFDKNRVRFYKKYVLKDPSVKETEETESLVLGSLVDCLITGTQEDFDSKFASINAPRTSGQMNEFGEELWNITKSHISEDGELSLDFSVLAEQAFNNVKYDRNGEEVKFKKKDFKWLLENFQGSDEELLYKERLAKRGKTIIMLDDLQKAEKIRDMLYDTEWTRDILILSNTGVVLDEEHLLDFEVFHQLPIQFQLCGVDVKGMLDFVHVNHLEKTIQPYDLKISYLVNNFAYSYWKNKYYLQVAMYHEALLVWSKEQGYEDYTILPMIFIVGDSTCQCKPVLWKCDVDNLFEGTFGFTTNTGRKVKGLYSLVEEIVWCQENQIWTTPKEVYDNHGVMEIKPFSNVESDEN